ncbi:MULTISPECIES: SDR family NAD(P)-dependent oxidoreductase [unclassified Arthrobacter]|uniref:SDR family NAD(P)-dependent oxidoreductase n=1 Tax=unclassified Arthrobacter TaxID=235627 RepID=UPI003392B1B1
MGVPGHKAHLGGLDVLVNNAGIAGPTAPVDEYDAGAFAAVVGVHLQGTFNVTQQAIPLLNESDANSIVTMSSVAGRFGYPNRVAYATTKWGLVGFAKTPRHGTWPVRHHLEHHPPRRGWTVPGS